MGSTTEGVVLCVGHFHGAVGAFSRSLVCWVETLKIQAFTASLVETQ